MTAHPHEALIKNLTLLLRLGRCIGPLEVYNVLSHVAIIALMQAQHTSILDNDEMATFRHILYPSLESFFQELDHIEPHQNWSKQFLVPLRRMGVESLGDMDMVTPESLHIFFKLPPVSIMDLFVRVHDIIESIHRTKHYTSVY